MSSDFCRRYFAAIDGAEPQSALEMLGDGAEFALTFAPDEGARAGHFAGGAEEMGRFIAAGDTSGWAHHILASARVGDIELVLGETRTEDGEFLGSFVNAIELDDDGRMKRYLGGRSPSIRFDLS